MTAENQIFVTFKKFLKKLPKDQTRGGNYVCVLAWLVLFEILRDGPALRVCLATCETIAAWLFPFHHKTDDQRFFKAELVRRLIHLLEWCLIS